jgi:uncharacterized protein (DUF3084 family)
VQKLASEMAAKESVIVAQAQECVSLRELLRVEHEGLSGLEHDQSMLESHVSQLQRNVADKEAEVA